MSTYAAKPLACVVGTLVQGLNLVAGVRGLYWGPSGRDVTGTRKQRLLGVGWGRLTCLDLGGRGA